MTTQAERLAQDRRRRAILALLYFHPGQTMTARALRDELEAQHGQIASVDKVRSDLIWLADVELVERVDADNAATLTQAGREIVLGRRGM
jgi:Fe2+ or Zn2+ uptake regulation protein